MRSEVFFGFMIVIILICSFLATWDNIPVRVGMILVAAIACYYLYARMVAWCAYKLDGYKVPSSENLSYEDVVDNEVSPIWKKYGSVPTPMQS